MSYRCGVCGGAFSERTMTQHYTLCDEGLASALISGDRDKIKTNLFRLTSVGLGQREEEDESADIL